MPSSHADNLQTLIESSCITCHDEYTETRLDLTKLDQNFEDVDSFRMWTNIFDRISSGEMPPESEPRPDPTTKTSALTFLKTQILSVNRRQQLTQGRVPSRRLSRLEYEHTLHDLLGIEDDIARYLPPESKPGGFDVVAASQDMSSVHVKGFLAAADAALDEAIQIGPKPPMRRELDYLNSQYMKMWFERPVRMGGGTLFRDKDDLIIFRGENYNLRSDSNGLRIPVAGRYRITVTGSAYQPRSSVTMSLKRQNDIQGDSELFAAWDVDEKLRTVSTIKYLRPDDYFYVSADELEPAPDGKLIYNSQPARDFKGEGVRIRKVIVEGPLEPTWPPGRTRALFPSVQWQPVGRRENRREVRQRKSDRTESLNNTCYEPVTTKPHYEHIRDAVAALAPRAFRRPVTEKEITDLTDLAIPSLKARRGFIASARIPLRAILVSPDTLFLMNETTRSESSTRSESRQDFRQPAPAQTNKLNDLLHEESTLTDHALASRLSYFLWRSPPDEELLNLANERKLTDIQPLNSPTPQEFRQNTANTLARQSPGSGRPSATMISNWPNCWTWAI
ncbi:MAG: DUF1587 domain-containing protein [Planctomycetota bacterium]